MNDIDVITSENAPIVPLVPLEADPPKPRKLRRRGRVAKWFAVSWLVFLTFSAAGANTVPYIYHSCDQFENSIDCSTALKGSLRKTEMPPVWAGMGRSRQEPPQPGGERRPDGHRLQRS
jgi:hypothetical protein